MIPIIALSLLCRYLASGCSFVDLHYAFRLGESTVRNIVHQVCDAIWDTLKEICLTEPTKEDWLTIAEGFEQHANFPNCIGAVDGKHIRIIKPAHSGSLHRNYKHFFSIVLLAVCDAEYNFVAVNVGADGKEGDSTIFKDSTFYRALINHELNIPAERPISQTSHVPFPFVLVGDEAFQLSDHLMRPYGGTNLTMKKKIFNYRLSRARRYIECTFGILVNKWRIFHRPLNVKREYAIKIVQTCCVLHNYVRRRDGFRFEETLTVPGLEHIPVGEIARGSRRSLHFRDGFADYFMNEGQLQWQHQFI